MRRIVSAITVAALALSLVASATQANAAVAGYDSAYAGESAFLNLAQGQSGTFTVFFANTGSTSWVKGSTSQVDLAACLEDKVTCNQQDASEAPFNSGWLSATRYTTQTQTTVAPGQIGTFTYNVQVPATQAAGTYRFNGALVLASTGADIRNEGYYQDVTVGTAAAGTAATLTAMTPVRGSVAGGTTVTLTGSGFICTPAFPAVTFDTSAATVTSCGPTTLVVTSPAHAAGTVDVKATNAGAPASNALLYTYADTAAPNYTAVAANAGTTVATLTFDESICNNATLNAGDFAVTVNGGARNTTGARTLTGTDLFTTVVCTGAAGAASTAGVTSFQISFDGAALVAGDFVTVTVTAAGAAKILDVSGNAMSGAQTRTTNATGDTTAPSVSSASARSDTTIRLTYNEPVICGVSNTAQTSADFLAQFTATTAGVAKTPTSAACAASATLGSTRITLTFADSIAAGGSVTYVQSSTAANRVKDLSGNNALSPQTVAYAAFTPDTTAPTITDAKVTANVLTTDFNDAGDKFTLTFSEVMSTSTSSIQIAVQDNDPSTTKTQATFNCATNVTCSWDTTTKILTVTIGTAGVTGTGGSTTLQLPLTITAMIGITDEAGNAPNLAGSDKIID